jgi:hypothetical protein
MVEAGASGVRECSSGRRLMTGEAEVILDTVAPETLAGAVLVGVGLETRPYHRGS